MLFFPKSVLRIPEIPGIYIFRGKNCEILYIGKAKNLKRRVSSYFQNKKSIDFKTIKLVTLIHSIKIIQVNFEFEALLLEAKLIKKYKPKYNVIWKDDKHYIYIKITKEDFPRVLLSRKVDDNSSLYFGPFPSTRIVRDIIVNIRNIIPFCNQKPEIERPCFYTHLGLCDPCPSKIRKLSDKEYFNQKTKYRNNIIQIKYLLSGNTSKVKHYITSQMEIYAQNLLFEKAAMFRNKLQNLDYLTSHFSPTESFIENPYLASQRLKNEQKELTNILNKYFTHLKLLKRIECYDISNIFGKYAVGSLVTFVDGYPQKNYYRRFKIKMPDQINDFAMLSEILSRRLKHLEWPIPDLFVVDGGKPQLIAFKKIMNISQTKVPYIGLAKEEEKLIIPILNNFITLKLPNHSPALHLIQRIRDEAHRFAHKYHTLLRLKSLLSDARTN
jgi:excinuclease ABC subunit C